MAALLGQEVLTKDDLLPLNAPSFG
jgi:hypothetical protein